MGATEQELQSPTKPWGMASSAQQRREGRVQRVGNFDVLEEIGRGSFAVVYRGSKVTQPSTSVAIKAVTRQKMTAKLLENLESEIKLLKGIKHRNIVHLIECLKTDAHIYLIMAYCSAGDLSQYIKKRGEVTALKESMYRQAPMPYPHPKEGGLNQVVVRSFLGQLSDALKFLRTQNIIHRDIKPQNLLLSPYEEVSLSDSAYSAHIPGVPVLQVADFGFARFLPQASMAETLCGSPLYMAPEILRYEKYDAKADLWSCGAVLYEMATGRPPFRAQNHVELLRRIDRGEDRIRFPEDKPASTTTDPTTGRVTSTPAYKATPVPDDLQDLIRSLLKRNPIERMSFDDFFRDAERAAVSGAAAGLLPVAPAPDTRVPPMLRSQTMEPVTAEQEGAFVRPPVARTSTTPAVLPSTPRKTAFAPKYIVGSASRAGPAPPQQVANAAEVKARDYATLGLGEAGPSRRPSFGAENLEHRAEIQRLEPSTRISDGDSVLAREYVVIDKGPVEVNALADELAAQNKRPDVVARRSSRGFLSKPLSTPSAVPPPVLTSSSPTPYPPVSAPAQDLNNPPPFALPPSKASPYGTSPRSRPSHTATTTTALTPAPRAAGYSSSPLAVMVGTPSHAISKVINMASLKLFGNPTDGILLRRPSAKGRKVVPKLTDALDPVELRLVQELEDWGQKAQVIFDFADTKLLRVVSTPPSPITYGSSPNAGTPFSGGSKGKSPVVGGSSSPQLLSSDEAQLATECLLLYIKALAFLLHGINRAKAFWEAKVAVAPPAGEPVTSSPELNEAVQWLRQRFNECHDKAEYVKGRIGEGQQVPAVSADKLIYDRALEMSRAAAVSELTGETTADCEVAYDTALYMLFAILDESLADGEPIKEDDKATVNKFIARIQGRLTALRKRLITK